MAYEFNGTNQYISASSAPVTAYPITMAGWVRRTNPSGARAIMSVGDSAGTHRHQLGCPTGSNSAQAITVGSTTATATTAVAFTTGDWAHIVGVFLNDTSRTIYLNGGNAVTNTTSVTPTGLDSLTIGGRINTVPGLFWPGDLAECAVWNAELTIDEIVALSKAISPGQIRPQSLVAHIPLIRDLQDVRNGLALTNNNGATVVDHPRIYQ